MGRGVSKNSGGKAYLFSERARGVLCPKAPLSAVIGYKAKPAPSTSRAASEAPSEPSAAEADQPEDMDLGADDMFDFQDSPVNESLESDLLNESGHQESTGSFAGFQQSHPETPRSSASARGAPRRWKKAMKRAASEATNASKGPG